LLVLVTLNKRLFDDAVGKICEALIPLKHEYYIGKGKSVAICTLSSIDLLKEISNSVDIMNRILIVGRLLSENEGIDTIIKFVLDHTELHHIIICGKEVKGHQAGQALISLYKNGMNNDGRIIGAKGPYPLLRSSQKDIEEFRKQIIRVSDLREIDDIKKIKNSIVSVC
jgi:tetrahydromethanopterin S-methyltransferase subunit A